MSIRKDRLDCSRERIALEMSRPLIGTGISVTGGGEKRGPYQVTVSYLSRRKAERVVAAIRAALDPPSEPS
jgi:hypothetical protein